MKRGTPDHPKMHKLARTLGISRAHAVGLLEMLWHWTAKYAIQGDIGKWSDDVIAEGAGWTDREKIPFFIDALIESGWIDQDSEHRLLIHDWADHADEAVRKTLRNRGLELFRENSGKVEKVSGKVAKRSAQACAFPEPEPKPEPQPEPAVETLPTPNTPPPHKGPLAAAVKSVLETAELATPPPLPTNGAVKHTRNALASEIGHVPDERIVGRVVQAAREADPEISDAEIALWVHAVTPDGSRGKPRGPAWWAHVVAAHIRERPRDVTLLRAFVRGELPTSEADAILAEGRAHPRLLKALRAWRFEQCEAESQNISP